MCHTLEFRTKREIAEIVATHQEVTEQSKREEQSQLECLKNAIHLLKNKHVREMQEQLRFLACFKFVAENEQMYRHSMKLLCAGPRKK